MRAALLAPTPAWRRVVAAACGVTALTAATPARAADAEKVVSIVALSVLGAVNATFTGYDVVRATQGQLPTDTFRVAQGSVAGIQALTLNTAFVVLQFEPRIPAWVPAVELVPAIWTTALTTHAIWVGADPHVDPAVALALSPAIAADVTLSFNAIAHTFVGRIPSRPVGIATMAATAPQVVAGAIESALRPRDRTEWVGLTAWSGGLLLYGAASAVWGAHGNAAGERAAWRMPAGLQVGPTMVTDGVTKRAGVGVAGVF